MILFILFFLLQNGIVIQNFSTQNLKIKQLYIKWNEKLILQAKEISLDKEKKKDQELSHKTFHKFLSEISLFTTWFEEVSLENIRYNEFRSSLHYKENQEGSLNLDTSGFALEGTLHSWDKTLHIRINTLKDSQREISAKGDIVVDLRNAEIFSLLDFSFQEELLGTLGLHAKANHLEYTLGLKEKLLKTKQILSLIDLPKEIHFWARDAIELESLELLYCHGFLSYEKPKDFYKTLSIEAKAHKLNYTYNLDLDAVHTETTHLKLQEGVLSIYPQDAYSYGMFLDKSWLNIDFTAKEEILTLYLLFEASLNKEILQILQKYKIKIPFYQHTGTVVTNLRLQVNLTTIDVDAKGNFYTKEGNFDYQKMNLDVSNLRVLLDNYEIKINSMRAKYKDLASAIVDVNYNAKKGEGFIHLGFDYITLKEYELSLANTQEFLNVQYSIRPKHSSLFIAPSQWRYLGYPLLIESMLFPFDINTLKIDLPSTRLNLDTIFSMKLQGALDLLEEKASLKLALLDLNYKELKLAVPKPTFDLLHQNQKTTLFSHKKLTLNYASYPLEISAPRLDLEQSIIKFQSEQIQIEDLLASKTFLQYDISKENGFLELTDLLLKEKKAKPLFEKEKLFFRFNKNKENHYEITEEELALKITNRKEKAELSLLDITKVLPYVAPLKHYKISAGQANFSQNENDIYADITLQTPYEPLVKDGVALQEYAIKGLLDLDNKKYNFRINDVLELSIAKDITIHAHDIGININGILEILGAVQENTQDTNKTQKISFDGKNTPLILSKSRKILADKLHINYEDKTLEAVLLHKDARADMRWYNKALTLYGDKFNDIFMENLFAVSKFRGGDFTFSVNGTNDIYDGVFYLENTNILDYTLLNNIFAFVNTLPALTTLSFPKYSKEGLLVKNGFVHGIINTKEQYITLEDIYLASNELQLLGKGGVDYKNDTIDLLLNLKTNIADKVSKIPLVGYLIFDGESVSSTLSVTGSLDDPKVNSHLAKDIIVAPLNIIKRTLFLPYHLLKGE